MKMKRQLRTLLAAFGAVCLVALICLKISSHYLNNTKSISKKANKHDEAAARKLLEQLNQELTEQRNLLQEALWAYTSNINEANNIKKDAVATHAAEVSRQIAKKVGQYNWRAFKNADMRRQFEMLAQLDYYALPEREYKEYLDTSTYMETNYATAKVCAYKNASSCSLILDPDIERVYDFSRDPEELKHYWLQWQDKTGTPVRQAFEKYVELNTLAAKLNNFTSGAEVWLEEYEDEHMEAKLEKILEELRPLYEQLHAYVRHRLRLYYGPEIVSERGPIPMHLLGNLWALQWSGITDILVPFANKPTIDVTEELRAQGYTPLKMFQTADAFFQSMNLTKMPDKFWQKSIIERPKDGRDMVCHASAWDFYAPNDARIKMCARVTHQQFTVIHHEMGHIQYFLQYQHQPVTYRDGANPGFHEAVGDVLGLSVATPKHLERLGLLKDYVYDNETRLNRLFVMALDKIVFLPFAYTMDKYRWALFRGQVDKKHWNCEFWKLRSQYSGVEPPVVRTEQDFDAPSKYHISADIEYTRYFVAFILQFQLYKGACLKAGQYEPGNADLPLDNCDFYGNQAVGKAFHDMLSLGSSKPWPDALEAFMNERTMTGQAMLEYFEPLRIWLEAENAKHKVPIGWTQTDKCI